MPFVQDDEDFLQALRQQQDDDAALAAPPLRDEESMDVLQQLEEEYAGPARARASVRPRDQTDVLVAGANAKPNDAPNLPAVVAALTAPSLRDEEAMEIFQQLEDAYAGPALSRASARPREQTDMPVPGANAKPDDASDLPAVIAARAAPPLCYEESMKILQQVEEAYAAPARACVHPREQTDLPVAGANAKPDDAPDVPAVVVGKRIFGKLFHSRKAQSQSQLPIVEQTAGEQAIAAEAWHDLVLLEDDQRRQHMHWVHNRTENPNDVQPEAFKTRKEFFEHLCRCYAEVYPEPAHRHGSILLFGAAAKEKHAASNVEGERYEHHHSPAFCSKRHKWLPVATLSHQKYHVKLHAATHTGYASMYEYITVQTTKKPLSELDAEVYLSEDHPRGDVLRRLLVAGRKHALTRTFAARTPKHGVGVGIGDEAEPDVKRFRAGDMYALVTETGVQTVLELQGLAADNAAKKDSRLAEFCTGAGEDRLAEILRGALAIQAAPRELKLRSSTRMDLLRVAATEKVCMCAGRWIPGVINVLTYQEENVATFCQDVCRALEIGAKRGTNLAIIGEPGCGKSMVFESMDLIFKTMGKPDAKSTFPMAGVLDAALLVWQDYKHKDSIILFEDLLSLIAGERMEIRVPHRVNVSHRNVAPMFFSSNTLLSVRRDNPVDMIRLNAAMSERFRTRFWAKPIPHESRVEDFPRCGKCCANFLLMHR